MPGRRQKGEGSVYHRGTRDQWVAVADLGWKNGTRDRREFTGQDPTTALQKRDEFLAQRHDGFTPPKGRKPYAGDWLRHWLYNIARPRIAATSWNKGYRQKTEELIIPFFEHIILEDIDEDHIRAWHAHLQRTKSPHTGRPVSNSTIATAHSILSAALNDALNGRPRRISHNPAATAGPPTVDREEPMPPDEDEVLAVLRECEDRRTGPRWVTAIGTGLRQGETLGLLWPYVDIDDIDDAGVDVQWELVRLPWEHGCDDPHACGARLHRYPCPKPCPKAARPSGRRHVCVTASADRLCETGCAGHAKACPDKTGGGLRLKRPKSKYSRARVPLPPMAAAALRQWRTDQKAERLAHPAWRGWAHTCGRRLKPKQWVCPDCMMPAKPDLVVFTNPDGSPVDYRRDWQDWSDLLEAAGLEHYGLHTGTRHGTATALLEEGVDIRVVQEIMRHASPDFTRKTYQHVRQKLRREAADVMNRRMGGR